MQNGFLEKAYRTDDAWFYILINLNSIKVKLTSGFDLTLIVTFGTIVHAF